MTPAVAIAIRRAAESSASGGENAKAQQSTVKPYSKIGRGSGILLGPYSGLWDTAGGTLLRALGYRWWNLTPGSGIPLVEPYSGIWDTAGGTLLRDLGYCWWDLTPGSGILLVGPYSEVSPGRLVELKN